MALALIGAYALQLALHIRAASVTYDEPVTILAGYHQWKCGDFSINAENPPLVKYIAAFPFRSKTLAGPMPLCGPRFTPTYNEYVESMQFLITNGVNRILIPARIATSAFSLFLALLMFLAMQRMFGYAEALVALALLAFEPNMIAHGSLATMDMAMTAMYFGSVFALYLLVERPSVAHVGTLGLAMAGMLASKHSALPAVAFVWILLFAMTWFESRRSMARYDEVIRRYRIPAIGLATATVIAFICLWASYRFHFYAIPKAHHETLPVTAFPMGTGGIAELIANLTILSRNIRILPEAYLYGVTDVLRQNSMHKTYLLGHTFPHGLWYYFPVAFSVKTSLALLCLLAMSVYAFARYRDKQREMLFLLLPAVLYFGFCLTSGLNVGVRHILPVYPLLICVAAAGACSLARRMPKAWIAIIALLTFAGADAARTFPNYISFSNELWGGTNNTYKVLSDSNVDWGQNLNEISSYIAAHNVKNCWIAANGTPDIATATLPCHLLPAPDQWLDHPTDDIPATIEGTVFLSTEALPAEYPGVYDSIVRIKPSAIIGGATLVYDGSFDVTDAAAAVHSTNAKFFYEHHLLPAAISEMNDAIKIAPNNLYWHLALGTYLAANGQRDSARGEFNVCINVASGDPSGNIVRQLAERQLQSLK